MQTRALIIFAAVLSALALSWAMRDRAVPQISTDPTAREPSAARSTPQNEAADSPGAQGSSSAPRTAGALETPRPSDSPVDVAARARFNEQARAFFTTNASSLPAEERRREAQRIEQELSEIERAGGLSAGEIFLIRAGLIRATVSDEAEQVARINALKERYERDSQRRMAETLARPPDPAFELYKVRESEIIAEVMAMQSIPDGLTREEYLRRRLQSAREQLMP
jgi:hypothetical protein